MRLAVGLLYVLATSGLLAYFVPLHAQQAAMGGAVAASTAGADQAPYINPVLGQSQPAPDPFILKWNGEYYLYATGDPILVYHSTDLVHWSLVGPAISSSRASGAWNQADVWAPETVYRNGRFYLYYTASRASSDWRVGEMARRVGVAVSDNPTGPFVDAGHPVTPGWAIDGDVFRDPDSGAEYLFYSYLYEPTLPGAGIVLDSMPDPLSVTGRPTHVVRGSEAWEDKDGDPTNGSVRYTNEAPTVLKRHGRYYMMYSGGSWDLPTYSMGYAVSDGVTQSGLGGPGWRKMTPPILRSTPLVQAPGHNTVVSAPNNVDDITAYHARVVPFSSLGDRQTFLDRLYWQHDRPYLEPPALDARPAPDRPVFQDLFNRHDATLGAGWKIVSGAWSVAANQAHQSGVAPALAVVRSDALEDYVFEANVRLVGDAAGAEAHGAAGVAAYHVDAANHVDVWLDAARRALVTSGVIGHRPIAEQVTPLRSDFRFGAYHQLLITKSAGRLEVALDGVKAQERKLALERGGVALQTRLGRADFDGVALTPYFEDTFSDSAVTWAMTGGTWRVSGGALQQVAGGPGRRIALRGDAGTSYEFTADARWRDSVSTSSMIGVVAAATDSANMIVCGFDRTIWPFARFTVRQIVGGTVRKSFAVGLPRGFNYDVYHTIRVTREGDAFTFHLDGQQIAAARLTIAAARPGLIADGARAEFDDVAMKRVVVPGNLVLDGSFEAEPWDSSASAPAAPWTLSGAAGINQCCAHAGDRRLLITGADGRASQVVPGLAPGRYTLYAWVTTRGTDADVSITPAGGAAVRGAASGAAWQRVTLHATVPEGADHVTISVTGHPAAGTDGFVAVDDVYLFRQ